MTKGMTSLATAEPPVVNLGRLQLVETGTASREIHPAPVSVKQGGG
jgi:hypothetical protein